MAVRLRKREFEITRNFVDAKYFSQRNVEKKPKKYAPSINLPRTKLPLRHDGSKKIEADIHIQKVCGFSSLYEWQQKNVAGSEFILHDGPPYANGSPHMGHAINKILKDITIRHKLLLGHKINYVPGWDCHGLPIELKALDNSRKLPAIDVRLKAREFANKAIEEQREVFRSWGILANWDNDCYYTFDKEYVKTQLQQFCKLYKKGLIYQDFKPVYWSPTTRTALAESELEYNPNHRSKAVTVRFRIATVLDYETLDDDLLYAVIWTTTPWTLPANQAICYNPDFKYTLIRIRGTKERYIVAADLLEPFLAKLGKSDIETLSTFPGSCLDGATYFHPFTGKRLSLLPAKHVTLEKGTGLVHTAPAHGPDDFLIALEHKIPISCVVDEAGCYTADTSPKLEGVSVLEEGNATVLNLLGKDVLHTESFVHSYPYDWRTKQPVILRASRQWFIDTGLIKEKAVEALGKVNILPERGAAANALLTQLQRRPFWCISRQRVWGVPIPVLYHKASGKPLITPVAIKHYCGLVEKYGTDFWWTLPITSLASKIMMAECRVTVNEVERGHDILDIWFDSGVSWAAVLDKKIADLYLEGVDQFNGWFQSSLMTSVAIRGRAPYKAVFVHGFAVDEHGKKMSKSEGNVIDPEDITRGKGDLKTWPAHGADTLRWWVACHATQHALVSVSQPIIQASADAIHKIRIVLRFLIGTLHDYAPHPPPANSFHYIDHYLLHLLYHFEKDVRSSYEAYQYNRACMLITNFVTNDVSALYCHLVKDRLYCDANTDARRRACQTVVGHILDTLLFAIAPVLPHLAEEVYLYHPHTKGETLFRSEKPIPKEGWNNPYIAEIVECALEVKKSLNKTSPVTNTLELDTVVTAGGRAWEKLENLHGVEESATSELAEILQVSTVKLIKNHAIRGFKVNMSRSSNHLCDRCRRYTAEYSSEPCARCQQVLDAI